MMKRIAIVLCVLAFSLVVFAACRSDNDGPAQVAGTPTPTPTPAPAVPVVDPVAPDAVPGMEGWVPFENRVTLTVPVYDRAREGFPAVDDHYWTRWIQQNFGDVWNIDVQFVPIPRGEVIMQYNLLIAARNSPVIMMEYDYPILAQWAYEGALAVIDLDEFAFVAPNYFQGMVDRGQLIYTDIGGNTHLILSYRPFHNTPHFHNVFVRMDWLRQVGFDYVPRSYAETVEAINRIIEAGLTNIPPLGFEVPTQPFSALLDGWAFRDFPLNEEEWATHSSLATSPIPWAPTREFFRRINNEFHMGWFSNEFELESDADIRANFIAGRLFSYGGYISPNMPWLSAFFEMNPDAELAVAHPHGGIEPGVSIHAERSQNPFGAIVGFSSLASPEQLQAAWMYMEWMLQPEILFTLMHGYQGITWDYGPDGNIIVDVDYRGETMLHHNMNVDIWMIIMASRVTGTAEDAIRANAPQGLPQDFTDQILRNFGYIAQAAAEDRIYPDVFFSVPIPGEASYAGTLHGILQEYFSRLVRVDPAGFDALYDQFTQRYLDAGYQTIMNQRLAAFRAGNSTRLPYQARGN
jgi:putative aldouronate transport system substrate-binding protein